MGIFKIRRRPVFVGGSADFGADCNLYRSAANTLKTDDAFTVAGAFNASAAATFGSAAHVLNVGSVIPTLATKGDVQLHHVLGSGASINIRGGGTTYRLTFPTATHGTVTCTVT